VTTESDLAAVEKRLRDLAAAFQQLADFVVDLVEATPKPTSADGARRASHIAGQIASRRP
jgi:hypothetical protein